MHITRNNSNNPNFSALKVATTRNTVGKVVTNIDIYKLGKEDRVFLNNLKNKVSIKDLYPKLDTLAQDRWQHLFEYCINNILDSFQQFNVAYLAVKDNNPCGLLTYTDDGREFYIDGICSIPTRKNVKENFVGKTLFLQAFKDFEKTKAKKITLSAVNDGPFDVVNKYKQLGFIKDLTSYPYSKMACNKYKVKEQIPKLNNIIDYQEEKSSQIDLTEILD